MKVTKKDLTLTETRRYYKFILNIFKKIYTKNLTSHLKIETGIYKIPNYNNKFLILLEIRENISCFIEDEFSTEEDIAFKICICDIDSKDCILSLIGTINKNYKSIDELFEMIKITHHSYRNVDSIIKRHCPNCILKEMPKEKII